MRLKTLKNEGVTISMILNYRVELCRQCYYKRIRSCQLSDSYIQTPIVAYAKPSGECINFKAVSWLPQL